MPLDRVEVSRRLKAARALRGVTVAQLAELELVRVNGITANLIGETEREDRDARQMELRVIADALDLPAWFFAAGDIGEAPAPSSVDSRLDRIESDLADFRTWAVGAVERMLEYRTESYARLLERLDQLSARQGEIAADVEAISGPERRRDAVQRLGQFAARDADEGQPARSETPERQSSPGEGQAGSDAQ